MNCHELREHYELYVIGQAREPECSEIRAHLNRQCDVCVPGIERARNLVALPAATAPPEPPSAALLRRVPRSVRVERRRFGSAPFLALALALALFAAVYFGGRERDLANELARVREQNSRQNVELTRVNEAFGILTGGDTVVTAFGEGASTPKGKVFVSESQGVLLMAGNLPPAPSGK